MYTWIKTRSGLSSVCSGSTCSSTMTASSSERRKAARVANPKGGNKEYLIGRQYGLVASVSAGRINFTRRGRVRRGVIVHRPGASERAVGNALWLACGTPNMSVTLYHKVHC